MTRHQRSHAGGCVAGLKNKNFLFGIDFPLTYHHASHNVRGGSDPANGDPLPSKLFGRGNTFSNDENVLEAVNDYPDGFDVHDPRGGKVELRGRGGGGEIYVGPADPLRHNATAIEINRLDVDAMFVPKFFFLDDAPQIGGDA